MIMIELDALQSIVVFAILFITFSIIQHVFMVFLYRDLFLKLKELGHFGSLFSWPAVVLHELVGHAIPAILSGSNIVGVDLQGEKGQIAVKYEKNLFGGVSVFIAGFGPTFFLPLLFILLYSLVSGHDAIQFVLLPDITAKFMALLQEVCMLENVQAAVLLYAAIVIAPGAASSIGDMKSVIAFIRESPLIVIVGGATVFFVLYASFVNGFLLSDYGIAIIKNTFVAYVVMYILCWLSLHLIISCGKNRAYLAGGLVLLAGFAAAKLGPALLLIVQKVLPPLAHAIPFALPALSLVFAYPLIIGLVLANIAIFVIGLKRKQ